MQLDVLTTADRAAWSDALVRAGRHDFYHEAWYHELAEGLGEGRAELLVASHRGATIALPLLFRPIGNALGKGFDGLEDATSVYGYPGPVGPGREVAPEVATELAAGLDAYLRGRGTVSLFSRLHPLLVDSAAIAEPADIVVTGSTVSIDLTRTIEQQWSDTRSGHRNGLNRLRRSGFTCDRVGAAGIDDFIAIYEATMGRLDARSHYLFARSYYDALLDPARGAMELFVVADPDGAAAAVGLFSLRCGIAQYHLSGATLEHRKSAPTTLLLDEARRWAMAQGATHLHLGGGLGGQRDSLFEFKAGFGSGRHDFRVWKLVLRPAVYRELAALRRHARDDVDPRFFPIYRAP